jgi:hypothetical protein
VATKKRSQTVEIEHVFFVKFRYEIFQRQKRNVSLNFKRIGDSL